MARHLLVLTILCLGAINRAPAQELRPADLLPRGQILEVTQSEYARAVNGCDGLGSLDGPAFTECMKQAVIEADAAVNAAYADAVRIIVPEQRAELAKVQHAWLSFYRLNCDFEKRVSKSTYYDCIIKMAKERVAELRNRIGD